MTPIQIVPYDPTWPENFARIDAELTEALNRFEVAGGEAVARS